MFQVMCKFLYSETALENVYVPVRPPLVVSEKSGFARPDYFPLLDQNAHGIFDNRHFLWWPPAKISPIMGLVCIGHI